MKKLVCLLAAILVAGSSAAQTQGTGAYAFAPLSTMGFDQINLGNLNVRFSIPVVNRPGRGLPFSYAIQYEGLLWAAVDNGIGSQTWTPNPTWGFTGAINGTAVTGYLVYSRLSRSCGNHQVPAFTYTDYRYYDPLGGVHQFNYSLVEACNLDEPTTTGNGSARDGSGMTLINGGSAIQKLDGTVIVPGSAPGVNSTSSITDPNGNSITSTGSVFTDTLGVTALTIGGAGTASSPRTLAYPVPSGSTTITPSISYRTYSVRTNFGVSGITEYGATSVDLVDTIQLADNANDKYSFTYEATPGTSSGEVTGRLASITLPTGGVINYTYTNNPAGQTIYADGSVGGMTRYITDATGTHTTTYARSTNSSTSTSTLVTDPAGNDNNYTFVTSGPSATPNQYYYMTQRTSYQGAQSGGNIILTNSTCYNNSGCSTTSPTYPITQVSVASAYNTYTSTANTSAYYDSSGSVLTSSTDANGNTTTYTYNGFGKVLSSVTQDSSSNTLAQASYGYDETTPTAAPGGVPQFTSPGAVARGNQTSSHVWDGTAYLTTTTSYYDTGVPLSTSSCYASGIQLCSASGANGVATTSFGYDSTQGFTTGTTLPTPSSGASLSTGATPDVTNALILSASDLNGNSTTVNSYDALGRPTQITPPSSGGVITASYSPIQVGVQQQMGSGSSSTDTETFYDGYGRVSRSAVKSDAGWYLTDSCYDATGRLQYQTIPYGASSNSGASGCTSQNHLTYAYDALGRIASIYYPDTQNKHWFHYGRGMIYVDENAVIKVTQTDLLGRTTIVCESTNNSAFGPVACGTDMGGTGALTTYTYDDANHKTTISQGAQTRVFQTDAAGRSIYSSEPEVGITTYGYAYNSTGLQVTRQKPKANDASTTTAKTNTVTQYDLLGRVVGVTYSNTDSSATYTPNKTYSYDGAPTHYGWSGSLTNPKGQMTEAWTANTGTAFSYDNSGRVTLGQQCAPSICTPNPNARPALQTQYDLAGNITGQYDSGSDWITYNRSVAGEVNFISSATSNSSNPASIISGVGNGPTGPVWWSRGDGQYHAEGYDSVGRHYGSILCQVTGCSNSVINHIWIVTFKGNQVPQYCESFGLSGCYAGSGAPGENNAGYDDLGRLTSLQPTNSSSAPTYTWSYDRYGNRTNQSSSSGPQPSYDVGTNRINGLGYDAAGNLTNDGIHFYTYDADGNQVGVDGMIVYTYDALNRRVRADTTSPSTEYLFDQNGMRRSSWNASTNTLIQSPIYWGGKMVAFRVNGGGTYFDDPDWLGTRRVRTDWTGTTVQTQTSLPFGDNVNTSTINAAADADPAGFAGTDSDGASGNGHAQFRQYSSSQGRWMSPDPYYGSYDLRNPQSFNRYVYAQNNPLVKKDPNGLDALCSTEDDYATQNCDDGGGGGGGYDPNDCNDPRVVCVTTSPDPDPNPDPDPCYAAVCGGVTDPTPNPTPTPAPDPPAPSNPTQNGCMVVNGKTVCSSPVDNNLNPLHPPLHKNGASPNHYRSDDPTCSLHVVQDPVTGETEWHYDAYNPYYFLLSHFVVDVLRPFGPGGAGCSQ